MTLTFSGKHFLHNKNTNQYLRTGLQVNSFLEKQGVEKFHIGGIWHYDEKGQYTYTPDSDSVGHYSLAIVPDGEADTFLTQHATDKNFDIVSMLNETPNDAFINKVLGKFPILNRADLETRVNDHLKLSYLTK